MKSSTRDVLRRAAEAAKAIEDQSEESRELTAEEARRREMDNAIFGVAQPEGKRTFKNGIEI